MSSPDRLWLLLSHADEAANEPVLKAGLPATSVNALQSAQVDERLSSRRAESERPDDLTQQRWGLVVPEGALGDRLLDCVKPLVQQRQQDQEGIPPAVFRVPGKPLGIEEAQRWRDEVYDELHKRPEDRIRQEDQPAYLLVLGDLHQISAAISESLSSDCYVGRLAFSTPQGEPDFQNYEAYASKVLRWERSPMQTAQAQTKFCLVEDGTNATTMARLELMQPALSIAQNDLQLGKFLALEAKWLEAVMLDEPAELLALVEQPRPTVLLTISHGTGAPRRGWKGAELQRSLQGAMSFGRSGRLTGNDIRQRTFLPGGVWFMLACYSAGTPSDSKYRHWLEQLGEEYEYSRNVHEVLEGLPKVEERPFIAALPQAALGNPDGPVAFMGHLDLAWSYSFQELRSSNSRSRPERFLNLIKSLLKRHRVGVALRELTRYTHNINVEITALVDRSVATGTKPDPAQLGHLWMLRQDLLGYVLLGDPAVRLPL